MSWLGKLYETYENNLGQVGVLQAGEPFPLLPVLHTTSIAHLEICVDEAGNWQPYTARVLPKEQGQTVIPCTEDSASRSGKFPVNHPLFDKLQYLAGDYQTFGGQKDSCFHQMYMEDLAGWCISPYSHPLVCAVWEYLKKGQLIADLVKEGLLITGTNGKLLSKWTEEKEKPDIFKVVADQRDAFVRICVQQLGGKTELWMDRSVRESFIAYQQSLGMDTGLCYVTGEIVPCAQKNPKKIRNTGDQAKLISSNDKAGFTYRGRFTEAAQAAGVGFEVTQKAHNALKWLIAKQGYHNGDQVIVTWGTRNEPIPQPLSSTSVFEKILSEEQSAFQLPDVDTNYAVRLNKAIAGYRAKGLDEHADVVILGLDSATPGRLSVTYYRELKGSEFLNRLQRWHSTCTWLLKDIRPTGEEKNGKPVYRPVSYIGAPSPSAIVEAAYGEMVKPNLKKATVQRLLPCIIDGAGVPVDLMQNAARRASNRQSFEDERSYERTLGVACALVRKYYNDSNNTPDKEEWTMSLEKGNTDRSYVYGRMLAYAKQLEIESMRISGKEPRETNAERLQNTFARHPQRTWKLLESRLSPYLKQFHGGNPKGAIGARMETELREVISLFTLDSFNNQPLSPVYLLGYSCQLAAFEQEKQLRLEEYEKRKVRKNEYIQS